MVASGRHKWLQGRTIVNHLKVSHAVHLGEACLTVATSHLFTLARYVVVGGQLSFLTPLAYRAMDRVFDDDLIDGG